VHDRVAPTGEAGGLHPREVGERSREVEGLRDFFEGAHAAFGKSAWHFRVDPRVPPRFPLYRADVNPTSSTGLMAQAGAAPPTPLTSCTARRLVTSTEPSTVTARGPPAFCAVAIGG